MILKDAIKRLFFMKFKKKYYRFLFGLYLCVQCIFIDFTTISGYCVTTPSGRPDFENADSVSVLEDIDWRKLGSAVFDLKGIIKPSFTGTAVGFLEYDLNHNNALSQHGTIGIRNNDDGTKDYLIDKELRQEIFNYINETYVQANPLGFTQCYLYSYNFLSPSAFSTYQQYITTKEYLKNSEGRYSVILLSQGNIMVSQYLTQSQNLAFIGTTNNGTFTSVQPYVNWQTLGQNMLQPNATINTGGVMAQNVNTNWYGYSNLKNIATPNGSNKIIMSPNEKNELVYVFNTLNAYKNYNSGVPQDYYLRSDWSDVVSDNDLITSGDLDRYGNTYSEVTNNIVSGMTADQVITLVDTILKNTSNGGSSSSDKDNSKWWERIGNAIGNLIDGLVDVLTKVIEKLSDALLSIIHLLTGYTDDNGTYHAGLFDKLTDLVDSGFSSFISSMFSWLPEEIVTLLTATLVFGIFFGIFKMLRR